MRGPSMASCNRPFPSSLVPLFQSESKCETILMKMALICMKMELHAELIFIWKVSHLDSFRNRGTRELGNGLFSTCNSLNISPHSLLKKNCCDLNLGESLCIFTFFRFPDSGLHLLNGFDFYFDLFNLNGMTLKTSNISRWYKYSPSVLYCLLLSDLVSAIRVNGTSGLTSLFFQ